MKPPGERPGAAAGPDGPLDPPRLRRTWPQRLVIACNIALVIVCLSSAWALGFYSRQLAAIPRIPLGSVLDRQPGASDPVNFLLVGADSTEGLPPGDPLRKRGGENLSDSMSILRVDPKSGSAQLLSLPRDLLVTIPGRSGRYKLNSALPFATPPGNPQLLIQTIRLNFQIEIHHYLHVNFMAFRSLVDELGGVRIWVDLPARDDKSGLSLDTAGCHMLDGDQALAYARSRAYEAEVRQGKWEMDPTFDLGRIARQRYFLKQAAKRAIARGARNPIELNNLIGVAQQHMKIDDRLTPQMIIDIAGHFNAFNPDDLQVFEPYVVTTADNGSLVLLSAPSQEIFDQFRDEPAISALPGTSTTITTTTRTGRASSTTTTTLPPRPTQESFVPHPPADADC